MFNLNFKIMANVGKKTLSEIITSKIMKNGEFNYGTYTDSDVNGAIELLQKFNDGNKKVNKNKKANEQWNKINNMTEEEQWFIYEKMKNKFGKNK